MLRNAIRQCQEGFEPRLSLSSKRSYFYPALTTSNDPTDGDHDDVDEEMSFVIFVGVTDGNEVLAEWHVLHMQSLFVLQVPAYQ